MAEAVDDHFVSAVRGLAPGTPPGGPDTESGLEPWLELNATFSSQWPNVTRKNNQTPADADEHKGEEGKFEKFFSAEPGEGD